MENPGQAAREKLHDWLEMAGLGSLVPALDDILPPLAPLLANALWLAQPAFGLLGRYDDVGRLAESLAHPALDPPPADENASPD